MVPIGRHDVLVSEIGLAGWSLYPSEAYLARKGAPTRHDNLRGHDIVAYSDPASMDAGASWLNRHLFGTQMTFRGASVKAVLEASANGLGVAAAPCVAAAAAGLTRVSDQVVGASAIQLVARSDVARAAPVRAVMGFLADAMARERDWLAGKPG